MILLWVYFFFIYYASEKPIFMIELIRHGARLEMHDYKVPFKEDKQLNFGDLTALGMRQLYLLGRNTKQTHKHLLRNVYDPTEHLVYSSSENRTIVSTICYLLGIYGFDKGSVIENGEKALFLPPIEKARFQIDMKDEALPFKLQLPAFNTPFSKNHFIFKKNREESVAYRQRLSQSFLMLKETLNPTIELLIKENFTPQKFKKKNTNAKFASAACGFIIARSYSQKDFAVSKDLLEQCYMVQAIHRFIQFSDRQAVFIYIRKFFDVVKLYLKDVENSAAQVVTFVGHDSNLSAFLSFLKPKTYECILNEYRRRYKIDEFDSSKDSDCIMNIPFSSSIVIEVYENPSKPGKRIRILFNGEYLKIIGNDTEVTLSRFTKLLSKSTPLNLLQIKASFVKKENLIYMSIFSSGIVLILLGILVFQIFTINKSKS